MADPRFFTRSGSANLAQIAAKIGAELDDPSSGDFIVDDISPLHVAGSQQLSFLDNKKYIDQFRITKAGACIVHPDMKRYAPDGIKLLLSNAPYRSYALASALFYPEKRPEPGISADARIHPSAKLGEGCVVGPFAIIGADVEIGENGWIESHAVINDGVVIGKNSRIQTHATVSHALIGDNVRIYPGVRIGQDGFGFAIDPRGFVKVPQLGRVVIEGHSEIGANSTIDRGALGDTLIGMGTWIDKQVQIGHNVKIGKGCVIVSQVGIAGSSEVGDYTMIGGQVGITGHLKIGSKVKIAAKSGVIKDIPDGEEWMGYPAMPMKQFLRHTGALNRLIRKKSKPTV